MNFGKLKAFFVALMLLSSWISVSAYDFGVNGLYYRIVSFDDLTCSVVPGDKQYSGDIVIPDRVTYNNCELTVTQIDPNAFYMHKNVTSVKIGNSVTVIGSRAFAECSSLTTVEIGSSVKTIESSAFFNCDALVNVSMPNSVVDIQSLAFCSCGALRKITIPSSVTSIGERAFAGCGFLEDITLGNSLEIIGKDTFNGCTNLEKITIPNSVKTIGDNAFKDCGKLKDIDLGSSVEEIGSNAFSSCAITEIVIPKSVKSIDGGAFSACRDLKKLTIEDGETQLWLDYNYYHISSSPFEQNVIEGMFYDCPLETVYVGRDLDVYSAADTAFDDIETLTDVVIGNNVTIMNGSMFRNCTNLTNLTIGSSVAEIRQSALEGCSNIKKIQALNPIPPVINTTNQDCFSNSTFIDAIVYVPKGSLSAYQNADVWKKFWNLQETETSGIFNVNNERPQNIWVENGNIIIDKTDGNVTIYNASGEVIRTVNSKSRVEIPVHAKGVYIVKTKDNTVKVAL